MDETQEQKDARLIRIVAQHRSNGPDYWCKYESFYMARAEEMIAALRASGVTIEPPPLPEPTYTVTLTHEDLATVLSGLGAVTVSRAHTPEAKVLASLLYDRIRATAPDPVE